MPEKLPIIRYCDGLHPHVMMSITQFNIVKNVNVVAALWGSKAR